MKRLRSSMVHVGLLVFVALATGASAADSTNPPASGVLIGYTEFRTDFPGGRHANVATMRATNGSEQSRLGFASELVTVNKANLEAANSRITDVDVASESTQLARWNVLVQAGTSMLAQANQSAQTALKLLQ